MDHREGKFVGAGGLQIYWQAWSDAVPTRAVVVLAHGASEHSGRYRHVADHLAGLGYPVYAIDHRGHGHSEGTRSLIDRMEKAVQDLDTLVDRALADHPGTPVVLLGHSMGGCIALAYALRHQGRLHALILSGPLAALEAAPLPLRVASKVLSVLAPGLPIFAVDAEAVSRDPAEVQAYETDPLVHRGKLPVRTIAELAKEIDTFERRMPELTLPLLVMHGGADRLTPPAGSRMVHERAGSADKRLEIYDGFFHEIFNEPQADRERVLRDVSAWLAART